MGYHKFTRWEEKQGKKLVRPEIFRRRIRPDERLNNLIFALEHPILTLEAWCVLRARGSSV